MEEHDKPILDVITDPNQAVTNSEILKSFYSVMKNHDAILKFVMLTGVSKFSKVSVFSGLNSINDIILNPNYADICSYTQSELYKAFSEYLVDGQMDIVKLKQL